MEEWGPIFYSTLKNTRFEGYGTRAFCKGALIQTIPCRLFTAPL